MSIMLQALILTLPVIILTQSPLIFFFAKSVFVILVFCVSPFYVFLPKLLLVAGFLKDTNDDDDDEDAVPSKQRSKASGASRTRTETEDFKKRPHTSVRLEEAIAVSMNIDVERMKVAPWTVSNRSINKSGRIEKKSG
jgi:hypothetical protein